MTLLTVNVGSSSVKLALFELNGPTLDTAICSKSYPSTTSISEVLDDFSICIQGQNISAIVHRIVHGGPKLRRATQLSQDVEKEIEAASSFSPLHNPQSLKWVRECRDRFGEDAKAVAVFDTGFFTELPEVAQLYAIPGNLSRDLNLKRYGFHGIAHKAMWKRWCELTGPGSGRSKVISVQLGSGCSITAIKDGKPLDTSMGFSPLEGLVMATRCGDIDPGLLLHLQRRSRLSLEDLDELLNRKSGLLGLSGISSVVSELLRDESADAQIAIDLYCYRIQKYLAAYIGVLEGLDGILFGGGTIEHCPEIVKRILTRFEWYGLELKPEIDHLAFDSDCCITTSASSASAWLLNVDEAKTLAEESISEIL